MPLPTIGRTVHYTLTADDAEKINASRAARNAYPPADGTQGHRGNRVTEGSIVPAVITAVWGGATELINGQAILDGVDTYWLLSRPQAEASEMGCWNWPPRD